MKPALLTIRRARRGGMTGGGTSWHPLASIGNDPEHRGWLSDPSAITYSCAIDPTAQINAFVTVDAGTWRHTTVGANTLLMAHSHIGHDAIVGRDCDIAPGAVIGGSAEVGDGAKIGMNATVLPFRKVGAGATVGAGAVVTENVQPGAVVVGNPARPLEARDPLPFSERPST